MPRYLSKSRFSLAIDCPTKLFYTGKKEYEDQNQADDFLRALAEGGILVGEYAKFFFAERVEGITISTAPYEYEKSIQLTKERLTSAPEVVIAEGAFLYENCYVRADIIVKRDDVLYLYEVKVKSATPDVIFLKGDKLNSRYTPYLYDVAFQKWVIEKSTGMEVRAHLALVNKSAVCSVDGVGRMFRLEKDTEKSTVVTTEG